MLQSIIENSGIPTVSISALIEITSQVDPPRVLVVDRPLGFPLGEQGNPGLQRDIMMNAFALLVLGDGTPIVAKYP